MLLFFTFLQLGLDADEVSFYTEPLCWTSCRNGRIVNFFKYLLVLFLQRSQISCSVSCCLLLSRINHFYPLNYTNLEVKMYVVWKFKRQKIKKLNITPTCFGSYVIHHQGVESCAWLKLLVVIHRYFVVCLVGVWQRNYEPVVYVYGPAGWELRSTWQDICESLRVISVKHSSVLPDDGSHKIRNMSEWF